MPTTSTYATALCLLLLSACLQLQAAVEAALADADAEPQPPGDAAPSALPALTVTATRLQQALDGTAASVSVLEGDRARPAEPGLALDQALSRVPGLLLQNRYNYAQGQRLSIRGFGARAPFGVRGVRVVVDGIPQTTPDGQSQLDAIDLRAIQRIEVLRGLGSALHGNASGGLIDIRTSLAEDGSVAELFGTGGSDGFLRGGARLAGRSEDGRWRGEASAWHLDHDGYSAQARSHARLLRARAGHDLGPAGELELTLIHVDAPRRSDMGGLTASERAADRRAANPLALRLDANQAVRQDSLGLGWRRPLGDDEELVLRAFRTERDFRGQLPFPGASIVSFDRRFEGASAQYRGQGRHAGLRLRYTLGIERERQLDQRQRQLRLANGGFGPLALDQDERADFSAAYAQLAWMARPGLELNAGLRRDWLRFAIEDRFLAGGIDLSGVRRYAETTASTGLAWTWTAGLQLFASLGSGFESPSFTEFANPSGLGGFNPELGPQRARGLELGLRAREAGLDWELALFETRVRDELVPFQNEDPNDARIYFRNAGRTGRRGLEAALSLALSESLSLAGAASLARYRYLAFTDLDGRSLDGRRMPGLPQASAQAELRWQLPNGSRLGLELLARSALYADDANQVRVPGHALWNLNLSRPLRPRGSRAELELFVAVLNLGNRDYDANIRINAAAGRYFEPAPKRSGYLGAQLRWGRR